MHMTSYPLLAGKAVGRRFEGRIRRKVLVSTSRLTFDRVLRRIFTGNFGRDNDLEDDERPSLGAVPP